MSSPKKTTIKETTITFTYNGNKTETSIWNFSPCSKCKKANGTVEHCGATIFWDDYGGSDFYQCLGDNK